MVKFAIGEGPPGRDPSTEPARAQEVFGKCSQAPGLMSGGSCVQPGVGLNAPCGSLTAQDAHYSVKHRGMAHPSETPHTLPCVQCTQTPNNKKYLNAGAREVLINHQRQFQSR